MRAASNPVRLGKYSLGKIFFTICKYVLLIFAAFCALVPLVSCIITAFKTKAEYNNTNVMTLPESWLYFDNFVTAWKQANMGKAFLNSFLVLLFFHCIISAPGMSNPFYQYFRRFHKRPCLQLCISFQFSSFFVAFVDFFHNFC